MITIGGFDPFKKLKTTSKSVNFISKSASSIKPAKSVFKMPDLSKALSFTPKGSSSSISSKFKLEIPKNLGISIPKIEDLKLPSSNIFGSGGSILGSAGGGLAGFKMPQLDQMFAGLPMPMGNLGKMLNPLNLDKTKFWILVIIAVIVTLLLAWGAYKIATHKQVQGTIRHAGGTIAGAGGKMGKSKMMG